MIAVIAPSAASHVMFCKVMRGSVAMICVNISGYFCVIFHYNFRMAVTNTSTRYVCTYLTKDLLHKFTMTNLYITSVVSSVVFKKVESYCKRDDSLTVRLGKLTQ